VIVFYNHDTYPHTYWLSNFHPSPQETPDGTFACAEAWFQYCKFKHLTPQPVWMKKFHTATGSEAFRLAHLNQHLVSSSWFNENVSVMKDVVRSKVASNPWIADALRQTGSAYLVEHTPRDAFWGDGEHGRGTNQLGLIWMDVREELGTSMNGTTTVGRVTTTTTTVGRGTTTTTIGRVQIPPSLRQYYQTTCRRTSCTKPCTLSWNGTSGETCAKHAPKRKRSQSHDSIRK